MSLDMILLLKIIVNDYLLDSPRLAEVLRIMLRYRKAQQMLLKGSLRFRVH